MNKEKLNEKEIQRIFDNIEGEIALITASAKFDFNLRKTTEQELQLKLSYIEDTTKLVRVLKNRLTLLWGSIGQ